MLNITIVSGADAFLVISAWPILNIHNVHDKHHLKMKMKMSCVCESGWLLCNNPIELNKVHKYKEVL